MSRPTTRLLAFLELLQDRPGIGGRELADRLEVGPRTVRRYATKLGELGIPVEAQRGPAGGYRLRRGYRLPPLMLDNDEGIAVTLGLLAARRLAIESSEPAVDSALAKILRVLPAPLRERAIAIHEAVDFTQPARPPEPVPTETVLALAQAIRRNRRVRIRHRASAGRESTRDIDPLGIVHHANRWYLAAYDYLRGEERTFRIDRVLSVDERSNSRRPIPDDFDPVDHVMRSLAQGGWRHEVEVVFHAALDDVERRVGRNFGDLATHPDGVLVNLRAQRLDAMAQTLAGLGWPFTIIRPAALRDEVLALAERLTASASRSTTSSGQQGEQPRLKP
jgi:predicted DNA-binding transcriptional regulator YafY